MGGSQKPGFYLQLPQVCLGWGVVMLAKVPCFGVFLLYLEIQLDMHLTPDHDAPGWPRRCILIGIPPAAALNAACSRNMPNRPIGAHYSHRAHTPTHHHTQACSLLQTSLTHDHDAPVQARRRVLLLIALTAAPAAARPPPSAQLRLHCRLQPPHTHTNTPPYTDMLAAANATRTWPRRTWTSTAARSARHRPRYRWAYPTAVWALPLPAPLPLPYNS